MKFLILPLLLLPAIAFSLTIDFGNVYQHIYISDVYQISVDYPSNFTILVNGSRINGEPVIVFNITNTTDPLTLFTGRYLREDIFWEWHFPETTKDLYYQIVLDLTNVTTFGNNTLYVTIYDHNMNLLEQVEIKFNLIEKKYPSTLYPPTVRLILSTVPLILSAGIITLLVKMYALG